MLQFLFARFPSLKSAASFFRPFKRRSAARRSSRFFRVVFLVIFETPFHQLPRLKLAEAGVAVAVFMRKSGRKFSPFARNKKIEFVMFSRLRPALAPALNNKIFVSAQIFSVSAPAQKPHPQARAVDDAVERFRAKFPRTSPVLSIKTIAARPEIIAF